MSPSLARRLVTEGLGTAMLLAAMVGSGIAGEHKAGGNEAVALLAHSLATGAGLGTLIMIFEPISGAHFNPVITLASAALGKLPWRQVPAYIGVQLIGAFAGVAAVHGMFSEPLFFASQHARTGLAQWWSEFVATFGLLAVVITCSRRRPAITPFAVIAYIVAASWFTASTAFANPAATLARTLTDTFAGIRPQDAPGFIIAQLLGAATATLGIGWLSASG